MYICAPNEIDKKIILTEATEMYQLKEETVTAAMGLEGALVVKDSAGTLVHGQIDYIDTTTIKITFSGSFSGVAVLN